MGQQKYLFGFLIIMISSCATFKKVQVIQDALSKSDTTKNQFVAEIKKVDSLAIVKNILSHISDAKLDYKTFGVDPAKNLHERSSKNHEVFCGYFDDEFSA